MLPRLNTKVHPQRSLLGVATPPSSFEDKIESYECLPSPSAPSDESVRRQKFRWFYNYPRLSFVFLFVVCTYIGGIYVSSKITAWTLDVLGVHQELTDAREMYLATSRMLSTMTQCVDRSSLEYLAGAKLQFETDHKRVQEIIDANDKVIADQRNATTTCSKAFLTTLKNQVTTTADSGNSTLSCFSDNFYANVPETAAASSSRALVLAVRALLATQAISTANDSISKQQTQFENQLLEIWNSVDTVKTSIEKSLSVANALASKELSSLAPILSDSDGNGHTQQSASRLGRLSKVASSELSDPLSLTSSTSLEVIQKAGRTLHSALEFLSGLHEGFTDVMDTVDKTWGVLEKQVNGTVQQAAVLQKELLYAADTTAQQINHTTGAIMTSMNQTQQEISTLFDILQEQWQSAVKRLVAGGFKPWQRLGDQLVAELTVNQRQSETPENSIQRKSILPDKKSNSNLENAREQLARDEVLQNATATSTSTDQSDKFDIDTAVLRASLVDVGTFVIQVVFYVDVGRLVLLAADLAVGLITESYSDMPMLDIRGITTVDSIGSVCEVFLCQHSFSAVCYTLVAKASELLRVLVTFLLLFSGASIVTGGLYVWKQDHIAHCTSSKALTPPTTIQKITRTFFENSGNNSNSVVDPIDEIEKYAITINESIRNDYTALSLASAAVWKNQSVLLDDSSNCGITTSNLVRMLQDCTEKISVEHVEDVSLSSQCLTSTFSNTSDIVSPFTTAEKLSADAPFLSGSTAFTSCFPDEKLLQMEREKIVKTLQHSLACATEKAVYLSVASWWLLVVIFVANRFTVRMIIKAAGVYWWRFLSATRLQFVGFCQEDGHIVASDKLPTAIQQHLREAKWQIISRLVGIGFAFTGIFTVIVIIFCE